MTEIQFEEVKTFIAEQCGLDADEITTDSRLYEDLGIYGDDAIELLINCGKVFRVDVSKFMAADYFMGEGEPSMLFSIVDLFTGKREDSGKKVLTVSHLVKGIDAGRLDEEIILGS